MTLELYLSGKASPAERLSTASEVHRRTGICPAMAIDLELDLPAGLSAITEWKTAAREAGVAAGAVWVSLGAEGGARARYLPAADVAKETGARDVVLHLRDPETKEPSRWEEARRRWLDAAADLHQALAPYQRLLISDPAAWGAALLIAQYAGAQAKVLLNGADPAAVPAFVFLTGEQRLGGIEFRSARRAAPLLHQIARHCSSADCIYTFCPGPDIELTRILGELQAISSISI